MFTQSLFSITGAINKIWDIASPKTYQEETELVNYKDPVIATVIDNLKEKTEKRTVENIFSYVRINIRYDRNVATKEVRDNSINTASEINERGSGVCSDTTLLTVTLLRGAGIPARAREGFYKDIGPHVWAEAFFDGKWNVIDVQNYADKLGEGEENYKGVLVTDLNTDDIFFLSGVEHSEINKRKNIDFIPDFIVSNFLEPYVRTAINYLSEE